MRVCVRTCLVLACLFAAQSAWAQATIDGAVKDSSGAVLPGVTVEAASPALIEKVRTVVSDGQGRYNITELRPGSYTVTFSLAGFNTVKREGVELTSGFTASAWGFAPTTMRAPAVCAPAGDVAASAAAMRAAPASRLASRGAASNSRVSKSAASER